MDGALGLGDDLDRQRPTRVGAASNWTGISASFYGHTCGLRSNSSLWCWGDNYYGELGLGDTTTRYVPTRV
jgi:alpha-tubulin suppressor-like RCC1 family protein